MRTQYYILLSLKTPNGFENYGQIFLGEDEARHLFGQLKGSKNLSENMVLHIDLMETINDLPLKINTFCCTLDELGRNTKLIAREIFRLKNWRKCNKAGSVFTSL